MRTDRPAPEAINHNNRRYYVEGVSARPNGTVFAWDDWKDDIDSCFSPIRHAPKDWKISLLGVWDTETQQWLNLDREGAQ